MATFKAAQGITRYEDEASHSDGFMVRLSRKGQRYSQFFADKLYGGKNKAKKAAMAKYQELVDEHGPPNSRATKDLLTHRNTSGHVGVHVAHNVDSRWDGCEYYAYCASWIDEAGKRQKIAFAWDRYTKDIALEMAIYARKQELNDRDAILKKFKRKLDGVREEIIAGKDARRSKRLKSKTSATKQSAKGTSAKSLGTATKKAAPSKVAASKASTKKSAKAAKKSKRTAAR